MMEKKYFIIADDLKINKKSRRKTTGLTDLEKLKNKEEK